MHKTLLFGLLIMAAFPMASANGQTSPPASRIRLAERLLDAVQFNLTLERFAYRQASAQDSAAIERYREFQRKYFDMPKLRAAAAQEYARRLTDEQLEDMARFFESPSGKKYLEVQPQIGDVIQPLIASIFREHMDEYRRVLGIP